MNILDILSPKAIKVPLDATERQDAINELVDLVSAHGLIEDPDALKTAVWEREQQRSTGIGDGLAIPHGKSKCTDALVMAIGKPAQPIDFNSIDRQPVRLVVLLASPPDRTADHIQALGRLSRLMADAEFRRDVYEAESADRVYELFQSAES